MQLQNRNRIGIITGTGPHAGIDLWEKILKINKQRTGVEFRGDIDHPEIYVFSLPELGLSMQIEQNESDVWETLKSAIYALDELVDFFIIACNTLHYYNYKIEKLDLKSTYISINEVLENYLDRNGIDYFALVGINTIHPSNKYFPYRNLLLKYDVENFNQDTLNDLHQLSLGIKRNGVLEMYRREMKKILDEIKSSTCFLTCTEFPLLNVKMPRKKIIDVNLLLATTVVDKI